MKNKELINGHVFVAFLFTKGLLLLGDGDDDGECFSRVVVAVVVFVVLPMLFAHTFSVADPSPFDMLSCTWP